MEKAHNCSGAILSLLIPSFLFLGVTISLEEIFEEKTEKSQKSQNDKFSSLWVITPDGRKKMVLKN